MIYTDVHTHSGVPRPECANERRIVSLRFPAEASLPATPFSVGVHPWDAGSVPPEEITGGLARFAVENRAVAIGECGLDRLCGVPFSRQLAVFEAQAGLAETLSLPLIIHAVRAVSDVALLHRRINPSSVWIVHGFRGKPHQAEELLSEGIYLSVGQHFNPRLPEVLPCSRMLVESDTSPVPLVGIYDVVARAWGMERDGLAGCVEGVFNTVFAHARSDAG